MDISDSIPTLHVLGQDLSFRTTFRIGRADDCEVCIQEEHVSRNHVEVWFEDGRWCLRDLNSANGVYVNGQRREAVAIPDELTFRLGIEGPELTLRVEKPPQPAPPPPSPPATAQPVPNPDLKHYLEHYFGTAEGAGDRTMMVRMAYQHLQKKQKRKYGKVIVALAVLVVVAGAIAGYENYQGRKQRGIAKELFYGMKTLDVEIADSERKLLAADTPGAKEQMRRYQDRRKELEASYDRFLSTLHFYDRKMNEEQRLVLRVARIFGECELDMPSGFAAEVQQYIRKWQSTGRFRQDVRTAKEKGYVKAIAEELLAQDLPPQFFYLAMQESGFDAWANGPPTRKGIAKGMWQFIPETAVRYGLKIGPLADFRRPDPADDRQHFDRATKAAARYLKDLYTSDAQASGLLVMACYNWGEQYVLPLVQKMPTNPKDRNYWRLTAQYRNKIPQETYDYVFYIVAAAVIGENPRQFGFDFDNPLVEALK
jgi:membrane-bound lytic murein transglycosylase D